MARVSLLIALATALAIVGPETLASELARDNLFGRWAHVDNLPVCAAPTDEVEQPFTLTESSIVGLEMGCEISSWNEQAPFWKAKAICSGEGLEWREDYYFSVTTDGNLMVADSDSVVVMKRCQTPSSPAISKSECRLDRTIFQDLESGRRFVAERVAYGCDVDGEKLLEQSADCAGANLTIVEGKLDNQSVVAVYEVWHAAPCCMWYSFRRDSAAVLKKVASWLEGSDVPTTTLGNLDEAIGLENPPFKPDTGPLAGGRFVPSQCQD